MKIYSKFIRLIILEAAIIGGLFFGFNPQIGLELFG